MRILLVEDDALTRELLGELLTAREHTVHEAGRVETALDVLERHLIDVLVTDLVLPGLPVTDLLNATNGLPRRIALTALPDATVPEGVILLKKPVSPERILEVIEGQSL